MDVKFDLLYISGFSIKIVWYDWERWYNITDIVCYLTKSKDPIRYVTINYKSEITKNTTDINQLKDFRKDFAAAVKNDKGRVRPTKIA